MPKDGAYTVSIDDKTLPKGVFLRDESAKSLKVDVAFGQNRPVLFPLGASHRKVASKWDEAAQLAAEGFRFGLIIALAAIGLSLSSAPPGLANFAHGELVACGRGPDLVAQQRLPPRFLPDGPELPFFVAAGVTLDLVRRDGLGLETSCGRRCGGAGPACSRDGHLDRALDPGRHVLLYLFGGSKRPTQPTGSVGLQRGGDTSPPRIRRHRRRHRWC